MEKEKLKVILEDHKKWLKSEPAGKRANLSGSDLRNSDLRYSDLSGSNLSGSDLHGSDLRVKYPTLNSHQFVSEILYREAKTKNQRATAGLIRISTDWCWKDFLKECTAEEIEWAKGILCGKWKEFEEKFNSKE